MEAMKISATLLALSGDERQALIDCFNEIEVPLVADDALRMKIYSVMMTKMYYKGFGLDLKVEDYTSYYETSSKKAKITISFTLENEKS